MASTEVAVAKKRSKKSTSILVFDIIFIVLAVLLVVGALFIFTPRNKLLRSLPDSWVTATYNWVNWHIRKPFDRSMRIGPSGTNSKGFTAAFYLFLLAFCLVILFYRLYQPFVILANNKAKGKKQTYRKVLCWVTFGILLVAILALLSLIYQNRCEKIFGAAYAWWPKFFNRIARSLAAGKLSVLNLRFISANGAFNAFAWAGIARIVFEIIMLTIAGVGKGTVEVPAEEEKPVEETKPEEAKEEAEEKPEETPSPVEPKTKPVRAAEKKETYKPHELIYPTVRDLELLASLEPIHITD